MKIGILGVGGVGSLIASRLCLSNNEIFCLGSESSIFLLKKWDLNGKQLLWQNTGFSK